MTSLAMLVLSVTALHSLGGQTANPPADARSVTLVRQHLDTLEAAAGQAKAKGVADAEGLAAVEKEYAETCAAVDSWRTAATSGGETSNVSRKRVDDLSKVAARAVFRFGPQARRYATGKVSGVDPNAAGRLEGRFVDAGQALARADEPTRQKLAANLSCRSWAEIR